MDEILADILIVLSLLVLAVAFAMSAWSVCRSLTVNKRKRMENGINVSMIGWGTFAVLVALCAVTLLLGSPTDMFIIVSLVMLLLSACCVIYSRVKSFTLRR